MSEKNIYNNLPFVRGAIPFILGLFLISLALFICNIRLVSFIFFIATLFIAFFFRDPNRQILFAENVILSPADGKIVEIKDLGEAKKIAIFMSLLDVHVNRIPINGIIKEIDYNPGKFLRADLEKASKENEKNKIVLISDSYSQPFVLIQIAGLIARRIICWVREGDRVKAGQRFGLICFGSRVELFMSKECKIAVKLGQKVKAGISILGYRDEKKET